MVAVQCASQISAFPFQLYRLVLCCDQHPVATLWCHLREHNTTNTWSSLPSDLKYYNINREQFVCGLKTAVQLHVLVGCASENGIEGRR